MGKPVAYLEILKGGAQGYILGVHFQKCSNFSIFFTLYINTKKIHLQRGWQGQAQDPPKYAPGDPNYLLDFIRGSAIHAVTAPTVTNTAC